MHQITRLLFGSLCTLAVVCPTASATTTVLDFEDLYPGYDTEGGIPEGYSGFNWTGTAGWITRGEYPETGYEHGTSGMVSLFTGYGEPVSMGGQVFTFTGAYISAAWLETLEVRVQGLRDGEVVQDTMLTTGNDQAYWWDFNWADVDTLLFTPQGDLDNHVVIDDITLEGDLVIPPPPPVNHAPEAHAGGLYESSTHHVFLDVDPDTINLKRGPKWMRAYLMNENGGNVAVHLDGSASFDPDGDTLSYYWSVYSQDYSYWNNGYEATLDLNLPGGLYGAELQVCDNYLCSYDTATIDIYETDVRDLTDQPLYLNGVAGEVLKYDDPMLELRFPYAQVAATLKVGTEVPVVLSGGAEATDHVTVVNFGR